MFYKPKDLTPEVIYKIKRRTMLMDAILILVIAAVGVYTFVNIEHFKVLGADVCKLCMEKTGAICSKWMVGG